MDKQKKQSVIPIYAVGLVWLSRAISGNLSSFGQIIKTVILSVVTYGVLRIFFPDKIKQADPEKPAQQPDAPKQAQTQKTQPQPEEKKQDEPSTGNAELDAVLKQGAASVEKIQSLNDEIPYFKLSAQIKQLENELSVRLFERMGKTVTITADGARLIPYAKKMLSLSDEMHTLSQTAITADIQVMEQMMASEGLTGKDF